MGLRVGWGYFVRRGLGQRAMSRGEMCGKQQSEMLF